MSEAESSAAIQHGTPGSLLDVLPVFRREDQGIDALLGTCCKTGLLGKGRIPMKTTRFCQLEGTKRKFHVEPELEEPLSRPPPLSLMPRGAPSLSSEGQPESRGRPASVAPVAPETAFAPNGRPRFKGTTVEAFVHFHAKGLWTAKERSLKFVRC